MKKGYWIHKARYNERWDLIAYDFYGDAGLIRPIIDANPQLGIGVYINEGEKVYIPVLEEQTTQQVTESTPPWQRNEI